MLSYTVLTDQGSEPKRAMWFLHGLLGTRSNLRSLARRFVSARPDWAAVLVDLRAHGDSLREEKPDTIDQCAEDLLSLAPALEWPLRGAVGHSLGGKIALSWLERVDTSTDEVWILDSLVGKRHLQSTEVDLVIDILEACIRQNPNGFESREAFIEHILRLGLSTMIAEWLAMNLRASGDGLLRFMISIDRIRALYESYQVTDLWPVVESPRCSIHLVMAGKSAIWDQASRAHAQEIANHQPQLLIHEIASSGHWLHVEAPSELIRVMTKPIE